MEDEKRAQAGGASERLVPVDDDPKPAGFPVDDDPKPAGFPVDDEPKPVGLSVDSAS